jgi:SSS family solute:Na+ symporter
VMTAVALVMAKSGRSVFSVLVEFNTVMSLAYGPPALLGLVVRKTPRWSGLATFAVGLVLGTWVNFFTTMSAEPKLIASVLTVIPAGTVVFLLSARFAAGDDPAQVARRNELFRRLDTPVDVERELAGTPDPTAEVFRFLSRSTAAVGLASLVFVLTAPPEERVIVVAYSGVTLLLALGLAFIRGSRRRAAAVPEPA